MRLLTAFLLTAVVVLSACDKAKVATPTVTPTSSSSSTASPRRAVRRPPTARSNEQYAPQRRSLAATSSVATVSAWSRSAASSAGSSRAGASCSAIG